MKRVMAKMSVIFFMVAACVYLLTSQSLAGEVYIKSGDKLAFLGDSITKHGWRPTGYVKLVVLGLISNGIDVTAIAAG